MEILSDHQKTALTDLLLSPNHHNIQIALNLLESYPKWRAALKAPLEVFYFFDSRRKDGPILYEYRAPIISFVTKNGASEDAHKLVGHWLEQLEPNFDSPAHPLFWLGSPGLLFLSTPHQNEQQEPNIGLPELDFMAQQLAYTPYLEQQADWLVTSKDWGWFIVVHLQKAATRLSDEQQLHYREIAWQYYQRALPHTAQDADFLERVAYLLDHYPPASLSDTIALSLAERYYEEAFVLQQQQGAYMDLWEKYTLFCYKKLNDSTRTLLLLEQVGKDLLDSQQWEAVAIDCQQRGKDAAIDSWIFIIKLKHYAKELDMTENIMGITSSPVLLTEKEQEQGFTSLDSWSN
jgi:hypothetical protein